MSIYLLVLFWKKNPYLFVEQHIYLHIFICKDFVFICKGICFLSLWNRFHLEAVNKQDVVKFQLFVLHWTSDIYFNINPYLPPPSLKI